MPARLSDEPLAEPDFTAPRWDGAFQVAGGARVFVRRLSATDGAGEPAVFVHGLGGSATNWTDLGVLLADRLDCVALDLPGFGRSGPARRGDYSLDASAAAVVDVIEAEARGPVHLFGNSLGGAVAMRVAADRPDLVRTLTLVSPAVRDLRLRRPGTDSGMAFLLVPGLGGVAQRRMAGFSALGRVRAVIAVCFAHPERVPQWRLDEAVADFEDRAQAPWVHDAFVRATRALALSYLARGRRSPYHLLARIAAPTLVVWGAADKLVPAELGNPVTAALANGRLLVLPDVGHCAQMEDPHSVARAVRALLDDASPVA